MSETEQLVFAAIMLIAIAILGFGLFYVTRRID